MTRSDLIAAVAQRSDQSLLATEKAIKTIFDAVAHALAHNERIEIRGFGSWSVRRYSARDGRNPKTGKAIAVPAKRSPFFKAGSPLVERLNRAQDTAAESLEAP